MPDLDFGQRASLTQQLKHGVATQGANPFRLLSDLAVLGRRRNGLQASEYLAYQHWNRDRFDEDSRSTFLGAAAKRKIDAPWINAWPQLADDALVIDSLLSGFELPVPTTQAVLHPWGLPGSESLQSSSDLAEFLQQRADYPLYCKPTRHDHGPSYAILSLDRKTNSLRFADGTCCSVENFAEQLVAQLDETGFLLQTHLKPHAELREVQGDQISTVRVICFADARRVEPLRAIWKIPSQNQQDVATMLLAGIDVESGVVTHVVKPDRFGCESMDAHPESGVDFMGLVFPEWPAICDVVRTASATLPNCFIQGWDVALCEQGPVLLRLHAGGGDPMVAQLGARTGLLSGRYAEFAKLATAQKKKGGYWHELRKNAGEQMANLKTPTRAEADIENEETVESSKEESTESFQLDAQAKTNFTFAERMTHAVSQHGANPVNLVSDVARMARRPNRLSPYEYFLYQLWDESRFDMDAKLTFLGSDGWGRINRAMKNRWPDLAEDKLAISALLRKHGVAIPETQAIYHSTKTFPGAELLRTQEQVLRFLRRDARYPLFGKPVGSQLSLGVAAIDRYDSDADALVLSDGSSVPVEDFVREITAQDHDDESRQKLQLCAGYLFQTRLEPHPELARVVGGRTGTVRMVCVADDDGVELIRASWKIPGGSNVADNLWRNGNALGAIDLDTGALMHVVQPGPLEYTSVTEHFDSGVSYADMIFPEWPAMREAVLRAAAATPDCPFQGWDVAMCADGPVVLELQAGGGNPVLAQLGYSTGLLTGRYAKYVERIVKPGRNAKT